MVERTQTIIDVKRKANQASSIRAAVHCPRCGYDLRGSPPTQCPECGEPTDFESLRQSERNLLNPHRAIRRLLLPQVILFASMFPGMVASYAGEIGGMLVLTAICLSPSLIVGLVQMLGNARTLPRQYFQLRTMWDGVSPAGIPSLIAAGIGLFLFQLIVAAGLVLMGNWLMHSVSPGFANR